MRISDWSSDVCSSDLAYYRSGHPPDAPFDPVRDMLAAAMASGKDADVEAVAKLAKATTRSEEHTSELQSLMRISYAVFCLKKKNNNTISYSTTLLYSTQQYSPDKLPTLHSCTF